MPRAVLCGVRSRRDAADGPRLSLAWTAWASGRAALDWAAAEADTQNRPLHLVHAFTSALVVNPLGVASVPCDDASALAAAASVAQDAARRARDVAPDLEVTTRVVVGPAATAVLHAAQDAEMVVLGRRRLGCFTSLLRRSVSVQVAARAPCPVTVVRPIHDVEPGSSSAQVVVGIDGSEHSARVIACAFEAASRRGLGLAAVNAWMPRCPADHVAIVDDLAATESAAWQKLEEALAGWRDRYAGCDRDAQADAVPPRSCACGRVGRGRARCGRLPRPGEPTRAAARIREPDRAPARPLSPYRRPGSAVRPPPQLVAGFLRTLGTIGVTQALLTERLHRPQRGPDPRDRPDRDIAGIGGQPAPEHPGEQVDLDLQALHHQPQRGDPGGVGRRQVQPVQQGGPGNRRTGRIATCTPHLASTACTSALLPLRNPTSLARWRTNSRSSLVAGGPIHASGKRPIRSSPSSPLHHEDRSLPPVLERLHFQRVRQMHAGTHRLQRVHRPVVAGGRRKRPRTSGHLARRPTQRHAPFGKRATEKEPAPRAPRWRPTLLRGSRGVNPPGTRRLVWVGNERGKS